MRLQPRFLLAYFSCDATRDAGQLFLSFDDSSVKIYIFGNTTNQNYETMNGRRFCNSTTLQLSLHQEVIVLIAFDCSLIFPFTHLSFDLLTLMQQSSRAETTFPFFYHCLLLMLLLFVHA
jgi:hypothetical protein